MSQFLWKPIPKPDITVVKALKEAINVPMLISHLLVQRGISNFDLAKAYFRPGLDHNHSPFLMDDMHKAVARIQKAMEENERILIYGDYDVDGTTSVSIFYGALEKKYQNLSYYIPDRYNEGYGVSSAGIDFAADNDIALIISLDCGIRANDKVVYAAEKGIDFIICDHHLPGEELPNATAILDPKKQNCPYPYKELSGAGVGFKLLQALWEKQGWNVDELLPQTDLLALSICADIVPITGENRMWTHYGLRQMQANKRPGLMAILGVDELDKPLSVQDVVFKIAPKINAAGRMDHAFSAVDLLLATEKESAIDYATVIKEFNTDRRALDKETTQEALAQVQAKNHFSGEYSTVVYHPEWNKGVIGIVASRLIEKHYRPTIVLTKSGDKLAGSARTIENFDVHQAIEACSEHLIQFGGHTHAAGLTMNENKLADFGSAFEKYAAKQLKEQNLKATQLYDITIDLSAVTGKVYRLLQQMEPFGPCNMEPVFRSVEVYDTGFAKTVGDGTHLKFRAYQKQNPNLMIDCIGFGLGRHLDLVLSGKPFEMLYQIGENTFRGKSTLQLLVKDIRDSI